MKICYPVIFFLKVKTKYNWNRQIITTIMKQIVMYVFHPFHFHSIYTFHCLCYCSVVHRQTLNYAFETTNHIRQDPVLACISMHLYNLCDPVLGHRTDSKQARHRLLPAPVLSFFYPRDAPSHVVLCQPEWHCSHQIPDSTVQSHVVLPTE